MTLTPEDLDGMYHVSTSLAGEDPFVGYSDGMTRVTDCQTNRVDGSGCAWTSTLVIASETEVELISTVNPSEAADDLVLITPEGEETREPVTYRSILDVSYEKDKLVLSGKVSANGETVDLVMKKI